MGTVWGQIGTIILAARPAMSLSPSAPGCGRWQTSTFLAALRVTGLTAPGVFDGAIDGESFRAYIEQILVPTLQPGDIVIADNLGAQARRANPGAREQKKRIRDMPGYTGICRDIVGCAPGVSAP